MQSTENKKVTPTQLEFLKTLKEELFSFQKLDQFDKELDSVFAYIIVSDDYDAAQRYRFIETFKSFKKVLMLLKTGEMPADKLTINL